MLRFIGNLRRSSALARCAVLCTVLVLAPGVCSAAMSAVGHDALDQRAYRSDHGAHHGATPPSSSDGSGEGGGSREGTDQCAEGCCADAVKRAAQDSAPPSDGSAVGYGGVAGCAGPTYLASAGAALENLPPGSPGLLATNPPLRR